MTSSMVRDSFEDFDINDETLAGTDNQELVFSETFGLEYGGIYSNSEAATVTFSEVLSCSNNLLLSFIILKSLS